MTLARRNEGCFESMESGLRRFLGRLNLLEGLRKSQLGPPLASAFAMLANPLASWRFAQDYWAFRLRYGRLLKAPDRPAMNGGKALIVGLHDFIPSAKEDGIYAWALGLRNCHPLCLVNRSSHVIKYYRVFGIKDFVFFDEYVRRFQIDPFRAEISAFLAGQPNYQQLIDFQYRGVHIGRHVLSRIARNLYKGTLQLTDPLVRDQLHKFLPQAMQAVLAAEALFSDLQPSLVLFNERGYTPLGEIFDVALSQRINTIQWVASHRDDARIYKRYTAETHNIHPHSLSDKAWASVKRMEWTGTHRDTLFKELYGHYASGKWFNFQRLQHNKRIKSKTEVQKQLGLDPTKKTAVIFSHILWDATFFYGHSLFDDYEKWLVETVRAACHNPEVNWVVKLHPVNVWRLEADNYRGELKEQVVLREQIGPLPEHVKLLLPDTDINTFSLFETADYCVTVRGTIGIEMAAYGVAVFTAGTGRYSGCGFTVDSATSEDYLLKLSRIQEFPRPTQEQAEQAQKYAYALLKLRPLPLTSIETVFSSAKNAFHALNGRLVIHARSSGELASAPDLNRFADWALGSQDLDFLL